jgi:hypothetical protein
VELRAPFGIVKQGDQDLANIEKDQGLNGHGGWLDLIDIWILWNCSIYVHCAECISAHCMSV